MAKHSCEVERTIKRTHGHYDSAREDFVYTHSEVVTEACGTPIFSGKNEDGENGVCSSCRAEWQVDDNYPTAKGKTLIAKSLAQKPAPVSP